jgi:hypothetical protein
MANEEPTASGCSPNVLQALDIAFQALARVEGRDDDVDKALHMVRSAILSYCPDADEYDSAVKGHRDPTRYHYPAEVDPYEVPDYIWHDRGVGWIDAWNGWYPTLIEALDESAAGVGQPWILSSGEGIISQDEADRRRDAQACILTGADGENADDCTTHDHGDENPDDEVFAYCQRLREAGYAITVFSPSELRGCDPFDVVDAMILGANEYIELTLEMARNKPTLDTFGLPANEWTGDA